MAQHTVPLSLRHKSTRPFIVHLITIYRENRQATIDLMLLLTFGSVFWFFLYMSDFVEEFYNFSREHESWELDDVVFTTAVVVMVCFLVFAVRRWMEAVHYLQQANTDSLTGLFNRRKGWEVIELEMERAGRYGRPLALVMFDIDKFKQINDTHGHLAGDQAIKAVSKLVREHLRKTDVLFRWGGDEFVIVCTETSLDGARQLAERIRVSVENLSVRGLPHFTSSFGVTRFVPKDNFDALMKRVDEQLYEAKSLGRNQVA